MNVLVVNQYDEITGSKPREELDFSEDIFRTASLWITNAKGDILLAQRKHDKKVDPGKWAEAVGGTVEGNDTYEQTIIREAQEELGIELTTLKVGPKQFIETPARYFIQWYHTEINQDISEFSIQTEEVEQIAWIPRARLLKELREQPDKYLAAMPEIVSLFS